LKLGEKITFVFFLYGCLFHFVLGQVYYAGGGLRLPEPVSKAIMLLIALNLIMICYLFKDLDWEEV